MLSLGGGFSLEPLEVKYSSISATDRTPSNFVFNFVFNFREEGLGFVAEDEDEDEDDVFVPELGRFLDLRNFESDLGVVGKKLVVDLDVLMRKFIKNFEKVFGDVYDKKL